MPRCYFFDSGHLTGDCAILMEDLSKGRLGNSFAGMSKADAETAARPLAVFHAKWWGRTNLERARWLPAPIDRAAIQAERFIPSGRTFLEKHGEQVDDEFRGSHVDLIDWPSAAHAKGVTDFSCLTIHGLTVNMRRTIETNLLRLYHNTLVPEGGTGYSIEQCQADYRSGFLYPFYFKVMVLAFMDLNDGEGRIMAHMQIERISAAIRDHNLVGLLSAI